MEGHQGTDARLKEAGAALAGARFPLVGVEPAGVVIEVRDNETIFDAAYREGYDWPTVCAGQGTCSRCHVRILAGAEHVSPAVPGLQEERVLKRVAQRSYDNDAEGIRLACQIELAGDVTVQQLVFRGERLPGA
ncbi:2Fe-2S iron-sulfur cluster-binding protein [Arthrobacter sp. 3Tela_A]|uniref:2Fe-2S iron-sulfur cluster-binding protein n=1 Tax=Arthrobacter sp. 3Tela_A TaxID=3093743 RepID=UPI003BB59757